MPTHSLQDLLIELFNSKQLLWGPFYNFSKKGLETLHYYRKTQLK
jgi:hypothetical protein